MFCFEMGGDQRPQPLKLTVCYQDLPDAIANFTSVNAAACAAQLDGLARARHPNVTADIGSSCIYGLLASSDLRRR